MDTDHAADIQSLWDYDDPAATETRFRAELTKTDSPAPPDAPPPPDDLEYRIEVLTQIARCQGLQREFDDAHATLDEANGMLTGDMPRARARCELERGRVLNSSGRRDEARAHFVEAVEIATRSSLDGLTVDAAHMIAIVESGDAALEWNEHALRLAEASSDPDARRWRGSLHNNIGWTLHAEGKYAEALAHFDAALNCRREQAKESDIRVARWCVARCLRSLERTEAALAIQRELETEIAGEENPDGYVYEEIAECLHALGRAEDARPYFRRAHELLSQDPWIAESEPDRIERLRQLAE